MPRSRSAVRLLTACLLLVPALGASAQDPGLLLYGTEGNRLRRYDLDTVGSGRLIEEILVERASAGEFASPSGPGRDVNGVICFFPDGSGRFVVGEDTGQPNPRAGWGIFDAEGRQIGKLTATYQVEGAEPFGCAFDPVTGVLYTTSVGEQGFGTDTGQLIQWFPPFEGFPGAPGEYPDADPTSTNFCKLAIDISTTGSVVVDPDGRVWVASSGGLRVDRFNPPFPTSPDAAGGCGDLDPQGSPLVDASITDRADFREPNVIEPGNGMVTPAGLAISPQGTLYVSSVISGAINEYSLADGSFLRQLIPVAPGPVILPTPFGSPQGIAVGEGGTVYYADLDLRGSLGDPSSIGPGDDGKVRRVRFDESGDPLEPEVIRDGLSFPDGVALAAGNLQQTEWLTFAGGPKRQFNAENESIIRGGNVSELAVRWQIPIDKVITVSPSVAAVDLPGEGLTQVVFFQSWDLKIYAARVRDGSVLWVFETDDQPGSSFPSTASVHVERIANRDHVLVGQGHVFYALDAATGEEIWRFTAGTGCGYDDGSFPGGCGFSGERNQIESSAIVYDGKVFFGMDVNDVPTGKGGFFALDAADGRMAWFFDLESGMTCRPDPEDEIRRYDGYHSEEELGLPTGFLSTRSGCDHPRTPNGCGNVWSSPALDVERSALFVASSNCDTEPEENPAPMPPFDEAIFSLDTDGNVRWVWRPRESDVEDLAFGGVPNLFSITVDVDGEAAEVDVVGVGNKDGTYYVLDRDGVNQESGLAWDDDPASHLPADLPYWWTNVVDGGDIGGIIATAAVDEENRRVHFSTAPGDGDVNLPGSPPQLPTVHALDMDSGAVLWQNVGETPELASFSSMLRIPGVVFAGTSLGAKLRAYFVGNGLKLGEVDLAAFGIGSTPIAVDGTLLVGAGIGTRTSTGSGPSDFAANQPSNLTALCVPGTAGCSACDDGIDNDGDGEIDAADDGCVSPGDDSEVLGDIDGDNVVDARDRERFEAAFGRAADEAGYSIAADLDPPGAPDGIVGLVDYQRYLAAEEAFTHVPAPSASLLGAASLAILAILRGGRRRRGWSAFLVALSTLGFASDEAQALTQLSLRPAPDAEIVDGVLQVERGEGFEVEIFADIDPATPIVGWGLDVEADGGLELDPPTIGDTWTAVFAADGDGLAGLASLPGIAGSEVLLASVIVNAFDAGPALLSLAITEDDVTEGFALAEIGAFDTVVFGAPLEVFVTPEPGTGLLLALALGVGASRRRRAHGDR